MGAWKSIKEMEEELTLEELYALAESIGRNEHRQHKFMAAIQGVDLDEGKQDTDFESIKQRAAASLAGKTEEQHVFDIIGIAIEDDD